MPTNRVDLLSNEETYPVSRYVALNGDLGSGGFVFSATSAAEPPLKRKIQTLPTQKPPRKSFSDPVVYHWWWENELWTGSRDGFESTSIPPRVGASTPEEAALEFFENWYGRPLLATAFVATGEESQQLSALDGATFAAWGFLFTFDSYGVVEAELESIAANEKSAIALLSTTVYKQPSIFYRFRVVKGKRGRWFVVAPKATAAAIFRNKIENDEIPFP